MSTPTPGPSRRRRIAGERRAGRPVASDPAEPPDLTEEQLVDTSDEATAETAPELSAEAPPPLARRGFAAWWGSRASLLVLAGILLVAVALTALLGLGLLGNRGIEEVREAEATDRDGRAATAAAERAADAILVYDHKTLDADQATAERFMTEEFQAKYSKTFEEVVAPAAEDTQATVTAEVKGSAVLREAPDRVRVLLFVDQTSVSTAHQGPQVSLNRVELDMVERSGTWLVDNISTY